MHWSVSKRNANKEASHPSRKTLHETLFASAGETPQKIHDSKEKECKKQ